MARRPMRVKDQPRNPHNEAAWRAVREFSKMLPTLTSFARSMTGNRELVVRLGTDPGASTNGKQIMIAPPIALGAELHHPDRSLCGKRGPAKKLTCKACAARETVLWYLYHEIGHNVGESTMKLDRLMAAKLDALVDEWHPAGACAHAGPMKARIAAASDTLNAVHEINGFLPHILKALEDTRVDNKMIRMRPGLRNMRRANTLGIFVEGAEQSDGSRMHWRDTPLNAQVMIGLLLYAGGNEDCIEFLSAEAQQYLSDEALLKIVRDAPLVDNVNQVLDITLSAWRRLTEMGLCYVPKCEMIPPPPPAPSLDKEKDDNGGESDDTSDPGTDDCTGSGDPEDSGDTDREGDPEFGSCAGSESDDAGDSNESDKSDDDFGDEFENESAHGGSSGSSEEVDVADGDSDEDSVPSNDDDAVQDSESGADPDGDTEDGDSDDGEGGSGSSDAGLNDPLEGEGSGSNACDSDADNSEAGDGSMDALAESGDDSDGSASDDSGNGEGESDSSSGDPGQGLSPGGGQSTGDHRPTDASGPDEDDPTDPEEGTGPVGDESVWDEPVPDAGDPEEIAEIVRQFGGHTDDGHPDEQDVKRMIEEAGLDDQPLAPEEAVKVAVQQSAHFDGPSEAISGVRYIEYPCREMYWQADRWAGPPEFMPAERVIGSNLMKARIVFSENKRGKEVRNLKSGRVNGRVLGKRAHLGDERLFQKRYQPGKRSYFVLIGLDCSGSNRQGHRMERAKRAVFAQTELLNRLGIPFAVYAHTGGLAEWVNWPSDGPFAKLWVLPVKTANQPWNEDARRRLAAVNPVAENYDGHQLHVYRRMLEQRMETTRILMYYTDGKMPAANYDEELALLQTEIIEYRKKCITLMAVGINTDSPIKYGFDTVRVDSDDDLSKVVDQLGRRLME